MTWDFHPFDPLWGKLRKKERDFAVIRSTIKPRQFVAHRSIKMVGPLATKPPRIFMDIIADIECEDEA